MTYSVNPRALTPAHLALATTDSPWQYYRHLQYVQERILPVFLDPNAPKRITISWPPQHGKSKYLSNWVARWAIGHSAARTKGLRHDLNVAICSYNKDVASRFGEENRDWFAAWGQEIFGIRLSKKKFSAVNWGFEGSEGRHYSVGIKGGLTSKKVDLLIVDDPLKDEEEARSFAARERVWRWFGGVANSRLSANAIVIVIQTRWHEDDLIGRIKAYEQEGGDPWVHINIPAIAAFPDEIPEDEQKDWLPDPLGRKPGEALCPDLHPIGQLEEARRVLGLDRFWKIYQGRPTAESGGIFQERFWSHYGPGEVWLRFDPQKEAFYYYSAELRYDEIIQSWDCTWKDTTRSDYVVCGVWARRGAEFLLLQVFRKRMNLDDTCEALKKMKQRYPMTTAILIEDKANGPEVQKRLQSAIPGIIMRNPKGTKAERAEAVRHLVRGGNALIPVRGKYAWVTTFVKELSAFPGGQHDDQVDMTTQALTYLESRASSGQAHFSQKKNSISAQLQKIRIQKH